MALSPFAQKAVYIGIGVAGAWFLTLFRIDSFTGTEGKELATELVTMMAASEDRIITRLNECREETRMDIQELRDTGRYHVERLDDHLETHGAE